MSFKRLIHMLGVAIVPPLLGAVSTAIVHRLTDAERRCFETLDLATPGWICNIAWVDPLVLFILFPLHLLLLLPLALIASRRAAWSRAVCGTLLATAWILPASLMLTNAPTPSAYRMVEVVQVSVPLCVMVLSTFRLCARPPVTTRFPAAV